MIIGGVNMNELLDFTFEDFKQVKQRSCNTCKHNERGKCLKGYSKFVRCNQNTTKILEEWEAK